MRYFILIAMPNFPRYMLVDNEDDNKTHRPLPPKDVSLRTYSVFTTQLVSSVSLCFKTLCRSGVIPAGPEKARAVPRQPGGNHERRAISAGEERRDGGHEEDVRQPQACAKIPIPLMT